MKKLTTTAFLFALLMVAGAGVAQAQNTVGAHVGYNLDYGDGEMFVGGQGRFALGATPIQINPALDYYVGIDNVTSLQFDVNGLYSFGVNNVAFTPYTGAGLALVYDSWENVRGDNESETRFGVNLVGGAAFGFGALRPFVEARLTFGDDRTRDKIDSEASFRGGVLFAF